MRLRASPKSCRTRRSPGIRSSSCRSILWLRTGRDFANSEFRRDHSKRSSRRCSSKAPDETPPLGIFRPMNELKDSNVGRIPFVHDVSADYTFCDIAVALGKFWIRHRIKGSAMRAKEGPAFRDWPCKRHVGASVLRSNMRPKESKYQRR